jgi:MIP family channel proteins
MPIPIHTWEPINNKFYRACFAEFLAMFFFVLMCCGCAMVTLHDEDPNLMQVATSFGFGILVIAQFVGPLSGGHINCAVSFGLYLAGRCSLVRAICYTICQMIGSTLAALFLLAIFGSHWQGGARAFGSNSWDEEVFSGGQVFIAEAFGTGLLILTVLATIDIPGGGGGSLGVFPIAMAVLVAHLFLLPIDGCSINPTRSFGPSLVAAMKEIDGSYQDQQYMFWFGPLFGAACAAILYEYGGLKPQKRDGAGDMDEAIFMSKVGRKGKKGKDGDGDHQQLEDDDLREVEMTADNDDN